MKSLVKHLAGIGLLTALVSCGSESSEQYIVSNQAFDAVSMPAQVAELEAEDQVTWNKDIKPIFTANCMKCHGKAGKISFQSFPFSFDGNNAADLQNKIVKRSIIRIQDSERPMPPKQAKMGVLSKADIDLIKKWQAQGLK